MVVTLGSVYKGEIVGRGGNLSNEGKSAIKHAEFLAMDEAKIYASQRNIRLEFSEFFLNFLEFSEIF